MLQSTSKPTDQVKSPYSVISSTDGPPNAPETVPKVSISSNDSSNISSKHKYMKGTQASKERKHERESKNSKNVAPKSTFDNDDGYDDDDGKEKREEESVANSSPNATLTTEKMREMMKQMNLDVGNSSVIESNIKENAGSNPKGKNVLKRDMKQEELGKNKKVKKGARKDRKKHGRREKK